MTVEKYCQITARDAATISIMWKVSHLISLAIASICSLIAVWNLDCIMEAFGKRCILYSRLHFTDNHFYEPVGESEINVTFHNHLTLWGSEEYCAFAQACYIFSMVIAMILGAFIMILPKGGHSSKSFLYTDAWSVIPLILLVSSVMTLFIFITHFMVKNGIHVFTDQIYDQLTSQGVCIKNECKEKLNIYTLLFNSTKIWVSSYIGHLLRSSMTVLVAWSVLIGLLATRVILGVDFRIVFYNLRTTERMSPSSSSVSSSSIASMEVVEKMKPMERRRSTEVLRGDSLDLEPQLRKTFESESAV